MSDDESVVSVEVLRRVLNQALDNLQRQEGETVELAKDFFWAIPPEAAYDVYTQPDPEQLTVGQVELRVHHRSVSIDARMEDMVDLVTAQNFVPVVDGRGIFCGIVTRRDVITYLCKQVQS